MRWLLTYADLITLLMVFFVMMYAMSKVDAGKFDAVAGALRAILGGNAIIETKGLAGPGGMLEGKALEAMGEEVAGGLAGLAEKGKIRVFDSERGIVISLQGSVLYASGDAQVRPEARQILDVIAGAIRDINNHIAVEGYTDDVPINTPNFPSNWELSTRRASNVVRYLVEEKGIAADRFAAVGYGEFRPIYPNDSEFNRAKNRRVDIVVLKIAPTLNLGRELKGDAKR